MSPPPEDTFSPFPRMPWRRRLLILLLAIVTAITVVLTLLNPPGGVQRKKALPADAARCEKGQTSGCVGGTATVITAPAASAPR